MVLRDDMASVEKLKRELHELLNTLPGLLAILITDREGVPILRANNELAPELAMRPSTLSTSGCAAHQAAKLGLGFTRSIICSFDHFIVVHLPRDPLVVTLIGGEDTNSGLLLSFEDSFKGVLNELSRIVDHGAVSA